ncbi:MAG: MFS transporter, partial [Thaumarchaeota archaeon]|nr:MFS transporter [Nitrososphaerota archaeon]
GMVSSMDFPSRRVLVADLSNESEMASLLGTVDAATGMGMLVAPSVGAYLWSEVGYSSPFFVASLINLGAIPLLLKLYRSIRR